MDDLDLRTAVSALSAGTQFASGSGTVIFADLNGISFGASGSSQITASIDAIRSVSAGTTGASGSLLVFSDANNVSFGIVGQTITASAGGGGPSGSFNIIAAGTQTATSAGTVVFSNSNGISFGMAGSTQVTASADYVRSVSAGTSNIVGNQLVFADSNGISFGASNGTITATVNGVTGAIAAAAAGTQSITSGTIFFADSNGISFGASNGTITATVAAAAGALGAIAAGTQTATSGTILFSNSNNVTFGMGAQSMVTASASYAPTLAFFENLSGVMFQGSTFATLSVVPLAANIFPGLMTANTFLFGVNGSASQSTASGSMLFSFGVYTLNGQTLSLLNSVATSLTYAAVSNNSTAFQGFRWLSVHSSQWSIEPVFSQTNYWLGFIISSSNATQNLNLVGQNYANAQGRHGTIGVAAAAAAGSYGWRPMMGAYTATTTQFPASIGQGDLNASFTNVGNFLPHVILNNAMSEF